MMFLMVCAKTLTDRELVYVILRKSCLSDFSSLKTAGVNKKLLLPALKHVDEANMSLYITSTLP